MKPSLILRTALRLTYPLLVILSLFFFMRGHNAPGGGFIGGLVMAAALAFYSLAWGPEAARKRMRLSPLTYIAVGLAIAVGSGFFSAAVSGSFLTGVWTPAPLPVIGSVGTPVAFDLGVYLLVVGMTLQILLLLEETA